MIIYFPPGFLFSCNLVAALFLMFWSLLSAFISAGLLVPPPELEEEELLLDELPPDLLLEAPTLIVVCLLFNPVTRVMFLPANPELGESERLLTKKTGLLDFGRLMLLLDGEIPAIALVPPLVAFLLKGLQSEQVKTDRGSFTSASLITGLWHS